MAAKLGTVGEYVCLWDKLLQSVVLDSQCELVCLGPLVLLTVRSSSLVSICSSSQHSELDCEENKLEVRLFVSPKQMVSRQLDKQKILSPGHFVVKFSKRLFSIVYYKNLYWVSMIWIPILLIYALNDFKVTCSKILQNLSHYRFNFFKIIIQIYIISINFRGWLLGNHIYVKYSLFHRLLGYTCIWLLGTFVNSSCYIKINIKIVQNCCRNLTVKGLRWQPFSSMY